MSQWDPNDPNNPYNQQWQQQQGQQQWGQQPQQQQWDQQQGQQQWDQQAQQQQWDQGQQQQWDQGQQQQWSQQQQQQWDQQAQQQQWDQGQQQQQWGQQPQQQQWDQGQQQQQQQQQGFGFGGGGGMGMGGQQPSFGAAAYQGAYNETFGNASDAVPGTIATLGVNERVQFIRRTYLHLAGALVVFVGLLFAFMTPMWDAAGQPGNPLFKAVTIPLTKFAIFGPRWHWLVVLAAFAGVSFVADQWAQRAGSKGMQYAGLALYVLAEALIFVPLLSIVLFLADISNGGEVLAISGFVTLAIFGGLTAVVFITKKDFSFLRGALAIGTMAALALIVLGVIFGFNLGLFFAGAMIVLASGYVLFYTSRVMKYYHPNQYVAAALALFACIALILWYVIQIVMELAGR